MGMRTMQRSVLATMGVVMILSGSALAQQQPGQEQPMQQPAQEVDLQQIEQALEEVRQALEALETAEQALHEAREALEALETAEQVLQQAHEPLPGEPAAAAPPDELDPPGIGPHGPGGGPHE